MVDVKAFRIVGPGAPRHKLGIVEHCKGA